MEGREAWQIGILGFMSRYRGIAGTLLLTFITMGSPFWWPNEFPIAPVYEIYTKIWFVAVTLVLGLAATAIFYYFRFRTRRSLRIKYELHEMAHLIRNEQTNAYHRSYNAPKHVDEQVEKERFETYLVSMCERLKTYFQYFSGDDTVEAAIRLAVNTSSEPTRTEIVYRTVARSSGLHTLRGKTSEDVKPNVGIPRFLSDQDSQGVLIYNDIQKAASLRAFKLTQNELTYPNDIATMMVAPLNAWNDDDGGQAMIGILYLTSRKKKTFNATHVDLVRFSADLIGSSIAFVVERLKTSSRLQNIARG